MVNVIKSVLIQVSVKDLDTLQKSFSKIQEYKEEILRGLSNYPSNNSADMVMDVDTCLDNLNKFFNDISEELE